MCPVQVAKAIEDWIEEQVMQLDDNKCALLGSIMRSQLLFEPRFHGTCAGQGILLERIRMWPAACLWRRPSGLCTC